MSPDGQFDAFAARLRKFIRLTTDNSQAGPCASRSAHFEQLALELFALQFEHNFPYRRLCETGGASPQNVSHWSRIPTAPAAAFKEWELSCLAAGQRSTVFHSSGTSERRPSRHFHNAASLALYEASLWPWFAEHLVFRGEQIGPASGLSARAPRLVLLTPAPEAVPHSSLVHMFDTIRRQPFWSGSAFLGRTARDGAWVVDAPEAVKLLQSAADAETPVVLLGTAFSFVHLLDFMAEQALRLSLPAGSRAMETGGYKGRSRTLPRADLHGLISTRLGIPPARIVCEYGMSELSSQAYDRAVAPRANRNDSRPGRAFRFPPWARAQVVSPETGREAAEGEVGLIRVFDLANAYSVMAVQTEDLGVRRGAGFELAGRAAQAEARGCSLMAHTETRYEPA